MYADVPRFLQERTAAGSLPIPACSLTELSFLSLTRSLENALVDEVGLGAFDLRKDVVHFLSSPKSIVVHPLALAACAFPGPTAARLFLGHFDFCMKFHKQNVLRLKNNVYLCSTKPEAGRVSPPFGTLKGDSENRYLYFPNPKENCELHRASGFLFFPTLFKIFGFLCLSLIDDTKVRKLFELRKQNQKYFSLKNSNYGHERTKGNLPPP